MAGRGEEKHVISKGWTMTLLLGCAENPEKKVRQENMNDTPDFDEYEEMARADKKLCGNGFTLPYLSMLRQERDEEEAEVIVID